MTYFLFACILTSSDAAQYCTAVGIRLCITVSIHGRYRIQPGDTVLSPHSLYHISTTSLMPDRYDTCSLASR